MFRQQITDVMARHAAEAGSFETPFDGVTLFRVNGPVEQTPGIYSPAVCIITAGEKRAYVGDGQYVYNENNYIWATVPTPALGEVPHATPEDPVMGVFVRLDTPGMSRLVLDTIASGTAPTGLEDLPANGFGVARRDDMFDAALARLVELLDDPAAAAVLGEGRLREFFYALLQGEAGPRLRSDLGGSPAMATTLGYVHAHLDEEFSIDDLARRAGMSRAVFDRQFKAATTTSPLQYIKALRLSEASMRIAQGTGIGEAATGVGYHNSSQFSREFRRKFGTSPREWARLTHGEPRQNPVPASAA